MSTPRVSSRSTAGAGDEAKGASLPPFAAHFVKPVFVYGKDQSRPTSLAKYREDDVAMRDVPYAVEALGVRLGFAPLDTFVPWSNITCCGFGL